jgi:hypothetical protein
MENELAFMGTPGRFLGVVESIERHVSVREYPNGDRRQSADIMACRAETQGGMAGERPRPLACGNSVKPSYGLAGLAGSFRRREAGLLPEVETVDLDIGITFRFRGQVGQLLDRLHRAGISFECR